MQRLDWIVVVSLVLCYLPAMFYLERAGQSTMMIGL